MTSQEDGTYDEAAARRSRRRKQAVVGLTGAAAVVAGGAFFVTEARDADRTGTAEIAAAPLATSASPSVPSSPRTTTRPPASRAPAAKVSRLPSPTPAGSPTPKTARERVDAARKAAAKNGVQVQRPLPPVTMQQTPVDLKVTETGSLKKDRGTMRVVSARSDLTGYRELAWPAGDTEKVGVAQCAQTFKFANNAKAERKPNLLICWRTEDSRSVYTVTVDLDGKPSVQDSVAALTKRWNQLG